MRARVMEICGLDNNERDLQNNEWLTTGRQNNCLTQGFSN